MKCKKGLSLMLAMAMAAALLAAPGTAAYAQTVVPGDAPVAEEVGGAALAPAPEAPETEEVPGAESVGAQATEEEPAPAEPETATAPEAAPVPTEPAAEPATEPTAEPTVEPTVEPTEEPTAEPAEEPAAEPAADPLADDVFSNPEYTSLLPVPVVEDVYLYVTSLTSEELSAMSIDTILGMLVDKDGNKVEIPADKTVVWGLKKDANPTGEFALILDRSATIDLNQSTYISVNSDGTTSASYYRSDYNIVFLVGSGKQLDYNAVRYIVNICEATDERISYSLKQNGLWVRSSYQPDVATGLSDLAVDKVGTFIDIEKAPRYIISEALPPVSIYQESFYVPEYDATASYTVTLSSTMAGRYSRGDTDVQVKAFRVDDYAQNGVNATDLWTEVSSNNGMAAVTGRAPTKDDVILLAYLNNAGTEVLGLQGLVCCVYPSTSRVYNGLQFINADYSNPYASASSVNWRLPIDSDDVSKSMISLVVSSWLDCYLTVESDSTETPAMVLEQSDDIKAVYVIDDSTYFASEFERTEEYIQAHGTDITASVLDLSAGYPLHNSGTKTYNILIQHKTAPTEFLRPHISVTRVSKPSSEPEPSPGPESSPEPTPPPKVNVSLTVDSVRAPDPDSPRPAYVPSQALVSSRSRTDIDSYAYNGYLTRLIEDPEVDMSALVPAFYASPEESKVTRLVDGQSVEQVSGESVVDFSSGKPVQYTVTANSVSQQNYWLTFVKKTTGGAKLFVNGPADNKRELYLVNKLGNQHNILIANLGDAPLENLNVTLDARSGNIQLDDYWTVGGEGNNTLNGFSTETLDGEDHPYGVDMADGLAVIRILPVGDTAGAIDGTLTITADGQEPVSIELSGISKDPTIQNTSLAEGVKYVPYSQVIMTDNPWLQENPQTFTLSGRLPKGLTFSEGTGEIYGVPQESGTFPISVAVHYGMDIFADNEVSFELVINENTNQNVFNASDAGYALKESVGEMVSGGEVGDYYLPAITGDELFVSEGQFGEFIDFWFNGEKLERGVDYDAESGSTRITIKSQTLANKAKEGEANTLAAEFRVGGTQTTGTAVNELKRTSQNFRFDTVSTSGGSGTTTPSGSGTGGADGSGTGAADGSAAVPAVPQVSLSVQLVDADENALSGMSIELHSTPQTAKTNNSGYASFYNVEFGAHTLYVKNWKGQTQASRGFTLVQGNTFAVSGDSITAMNGGSLRLKVRLNNDGTLSFVAASGVPKTGDAFHPGLLWVLLTASGIGLIALCAMKKRRRSRNG